MKQNITKKLYDITFDESHHFGVENFLKFVVQNTTNKDEIKDIINERLQYSHKAGQYKVHSVKVESHDLMDINGRTFISQDTEDLGEYTVLYPNEKLDQRYVSYAPDRNVIDLNLNLIQKAKQR